MLASYGQVGIVAATYHLPGPPVDLLEWGPGDGVPPALLDQLVTAGYRQFHQASGESDAELCAIAIDRLLADVPVPPEKIAYLVQAHAQSFCAPPAPTSLLADLAGRYGFRPKLSFAVEHLGCSSIFPAMRFAARMLGDDDTADYALVVSADRVFGNHRFRLRPNGGPQSDSASAILIGKEALRARFGCFGNQNFPRVYEGLAKPDNAALIGRTSWLLTRQLCRDVTAGAGLPLETLGRILPTNSHPEYWRQIGGALDLPESRFFLDNIARIGHACCADFAINLVDDGFAVLDSGKAVLSCGRTNIGAHSAVALLPTANAGTNRSEETFV